MMSSTVAKSPSCTMARSTYVPGLLNVASVTQQLAPAASPALLSARCTPNRRLGRDQPRPVA